MKRVYLWAELLVISVGLPLLLWWLEKPMWGFTLLWVLAALGAVWLHKTPGFSWPQEWNMPLVRQHRRALVVALPCVFIAVLLPTLWLAPERLLQFPAERPLMWLTVMLLYPLLSALPQEVLLRSVWQRRYAPILPQREVMLLASAAVFAHVHLIFNNAVAVGLSFVAGLLLTATYQRLPSLALALLLHTVLGWGVFTFGLGWYFFRGGAGYQ